MTVEYEGVPSDIARRLEAIELEFVQVNELAMKLVDLLKWAADVIEDGEWHEAYDEVISEY